jgi:hypothetical protein
MNLSKYLDEVSHAVATVMGELHREQNRLAEVRGELAVLTAATEDGYRRSEWLAMNPELDDENLGTAIHWDTYFGPDKERYHKEQEATSIQDRITVREFSVSALSGSLLQYARQGIAIEWGPDMNGCPAGRDVRGIPLNDLIWFARNQALHWEERTFRRPTLAVFDYLKATVDRTFGAYTERSMAYEVVCLLGWRTPDDFTRDLRLFVKNEHPNS